MSLFGRGSEKREEHTVYGIGINGKGAMSAAEENLPPNAVVTSSEFYPLEGQTHIRAKVTYQLQPVPELSRGHGAAGPTPWEKILYEGR